MESVKTVAYVIIGLLLVAGSLCLATVQEPSCLCVMAFIIGIPVGTVLMSIGITRYLID